MLCSSILLLFSLFKPCPNDLRSWTLLLENIKKSKKSELEGTSITLPEHVIKEIIFQEIDEQMLKGRTPQS